MITSFRTDGNTKCEQPLGFHNHQNSAHLNLGIHNQLTVQIFVPALELIPCNSCVCDMCLFVFSDIVEEDQTEWEDSGYAEACLCSHSAVQEEDWEAND